MASRGHAALCCCHEIFLDDAVSKCHIPITGPAITPLAKGFWHLHKSRQRGLCGQQWTIPTDAASISSSRRTRQAALGPCALVAVLPSTSVEAVLPPPVTQGTEAAPPAEVRPLVAEDSGAVESDAPLDDSLTWAERVKLEEAESCKLSPCPQLVENPEDGQALAAAPP